MSNTDNTIKLITDAVRDLAEAKDKQIKALTDQVDDLTEEVNDLEIQCRLKIPAEVDNIVMASALESLIEKLPNIPPADIENFLNQY